MRTMIAKAVAKHSSSSLRSQKGQVLVIFAGGMVAFMMLMAMVVDIGWYWSNGLRIQRAADAGALAGSVYLPCQTALVNNTCAAADTAAKAAAKRNGYDTLDANTTVTTTVNPSVNPRQLNVTISAKVGTMFLKVVGIQTLDAAKISKAEFVLPVPMGSPLSYYGVGTFVGITRPTVTTPATTASNPSNVGTGSWTNPSNAYKKNKYATDATNGQSQVWNGFSFGSFASGAAIDGLTLDLTLKDSSLATGGATCAVKAEVSWNGGTNWGNLPLTTSPSLTKSDVVYTLGSPTDESVWGSNHSPWVTGDFSNFAVRLTYLKGTGCGTVSLGSINTTVYSHTTTTGSPAETTIPINDPNNHAISPQGFWGAVITKGGDRSNGDQYDPANDSRHGTPNADFNGLGR